MKKISAIVLCIVVIMALLAGCSLPQDVFGMENKNKNLRPGYSTFTMSKGDGEYETHTVILRELGEDNKTLHVIYEPPLDDITRKPHNAEITVYAKEGNFGEPQKVELESFYEELGQITIFEEQYVYKKGSYITSDFIVVLDNGTDKQYRICKESVAQSDPIGEYFSLMRVWD